MTGFNRDSTGVTDQVVLVADNVDFTGGSAPAPQVTTDGQLLIGASTGRPMRVGNLTSLDGSVAITNGPGTIDLSTLAAAALVFIETLTASNSPSIVFTNLTSYLTYFILIDDLEPVNSGDFLKMRESQDNGSTFVGTPFYNGSILFYDYSTTVFNNNYTATGSDYFPISGPMLHQAMVGSLGMVNMWVTNLNSPTNTLVYTGEAYYVDTNFMHSARGILTGLGGPNINALGFFFSTGNINQGRFSLYGLRRS